MKCNKLLWVILAAGVVSFFALAERSSAAPTVFFARDNNTAGIIPIPFPNSQAEFDAFTSGLNSFGVDDIEDLNPVLSFAPTGVTGTALGTAPTPNTGFGIGDASLNEAENFPPPFNAPVSNTIFKFDRPITAFGVFIIQGGDEDTDPIDPQPNHNNNPTTFVLRNTLTSSEVDLALQIGPDWGFFNLFFWGVQSPDFAFDEVEIVESIDALDGMLYDNVVVGFIPEPGSFALLAIAGACVVCRAGRSRRS